MTSGNVEKHLPEAQSRVGGHWRAPSITPVQRRSTLKSVDLSFHHEEDMSEQIWALLANLSLVPMSQKSQAAIVLHI